ncbi:MAG: Fic family protein, partial [Parachlamydiaceae bacterium]
MPRNIQNENEKLIHIIGLSSNGLTVEEILQAFNKTIPKRTLQYRLSKLVKLNLLKHVGAGRSSRYHPPTKPEKRVKEEPSTYHTFPLIPLTEEALNVKKLISQPLQLRRHVSYQKRFLSYQKRFLEEYRPNTTFYLSKSDLEKLQSLGSGVEKGRPAGTYAKKVYQRLLVDLSWNSSRLEGNTYSLLETEKLLAFGEVAEGKDSLEAQMILNHKEAIEFIVEM